MEHRGADAVAGEPFDRNGRQGAPTSAAAAASDEVRDADDTPRSENLDEESALALGARIQGSAAQIAESTCEFLLLIAEFERSEALRWFVGLKSVAHWVAWACSMSAGAAREHVRVARALVDMPLTIEAFCTGHLSYSKVREMTRVSHHVDEAHLLELARSMTASQLTRTVRSFRAVMGTRIPQDDITEASWSVREDGMIELRVVLPPELGAEVVTAIDLGVDREQEAEAAAAASRAADGRGQGVTGDAPLLGIGRLRAEAVVQMARTFVEAGGADRSGQDRHLVMVQVDAASLAASRIELRTAADRNASANAAVGTPTRDTRGTREDVPAGTFSERGPTPNGVPDPPWEKAATARSGGRRWQRAGIVGRAALEAATAERLACDNPVALVITADDGEILHLGRRRRLASPAQRRALRLRDQTCQFPGCEQTRHLDAHHIVPWSRGGLTDVEDLVLLCRRHHVHCHEKGLRLMRTPRTDANGREPAGENRFRVVDAAGRDVRSGWPAPLERQFLDGWLPQAGADPRDAGCTSAAMGARAANPDSVDEGWGAGHDADFPSRAGLDGDVAHHSTPDPARISSTTGGYGFRLVECVSALVGARTPERR